MKWRAVFECCNPRANHLISQSFNLGALERRANCLFITGSRRLTYLLTCKCEEVDACSGFIDGGKFACCYTC